MKLDMLKLVVFLSWVFSALISGAKISELFLYLFALLAAGAELMMVTTQFKVMSWFSLIWIAYLISISFGKRTENGLIQKYFMIQMVGGLLAVLGATLSTSLGGHVVLVLAGVLISLPTVLHSVFFSRYYCSITKRAFLFSVVLPAMVGIDLLYSLKGELVQVDGGLFRFLLIGLGVAGFISNSFFAVSERGARSVVVFVTQAWISLMMVLITNDSLDVPLALSAVFVLLINGSLIFTESGLFTRRIAFLTGTILASFPCFVGFNAIFYSIRALSEYSIVALVALAIAFLLQTAAVVIIYSRNKGERDTPDLRLFCLCGINFICGMAIHLLGIKNGD